MTPVTEFVISRKKWLCGEGSSASVLFRPEDQKQCCVGIYLSACGVDNETLSKRSAARLLGLSKLPKWMTEENDGEIQDRFSVIGYLYATNDERGTPDFERESRIAELFARNGVTVSFED